MVGLGLIEFQGPSEGVQNLTGHSAEVAAFHPGVVLDTDSCEHGDLFSAQPRHPAAPAADDARPLWGDPVPACAQELRHVPPMIHTFNRSLAT